MQSNSFNKLRFLSLTLVAVLMVATLLHLHHRHEKTLESQLQAHCSICEVAQHSRSVDFAANTPRVWHPIPTTTLEYPPTLEIETLVFSKNQARAPPTHA